MMDRMQKTTDPQERQKLMREHMQSMREGMGMMKGMGSGMMGGDPKHRQEMMGSRMDMMQMMMEQMMQHQQMASPPPAK
jgi:hypothetical protein